MFTILVGLLNNLRILKYFNLVAKTLLNGKKFSIPVIKAMGKENLAVSEQWMCRIFEKLLPLKEGLFIDVGVNTGQTLLKLRSVDNDREYIGFEPNPVCVFYVQELISINKFHNTALYPVGLADRTQLTELNFFTREATDAAASIVKDFRDSGTICNKEIIPCFRFSDINLSIPEKVAMIKIDVEGAELEVIGGMKEILQQERPFVIIEILPVYEAKNVSRLARQREVEKIFSSLHYKIIRIHKKGKLGIENLDPITEFGIHGNMEWNDYLLCPEEFMNTIAGKHHT